MQLMEPAWYTMRTKPKHEHIAAANLRRNLTLPVFFPRIRLEKVTRRGLVRVAEPLFPCYIFVRCVLEERFSDIQHTVGVNRLVNFGGKIPEVADSIQFRMFFQNSADRSVKGLLARLLFDCSAIFDPSLFSTPTSSKTSRQIWSPSFASRSRTRKRVAWSE